MPAYRREWKDRQVIIPAAIVEIRDKLQKAMDSYDFTHVERISLQDLKRAKIYIEKPSPLYSFLTELIGEREDDTRFENQLDQIVFISCGQRTQEEKRLGQQIGQLVRNLTPFKPYFAENQASLEGLTSHIFNALRRAAGFIAVLHRRGFVSLEATGEGPALTRASVWVEQEIAIAAFLRQSMGIPIEVMGFIEKGIALEGVRQYVLMNPIEFERNDEVLLRLQETLPSWSQSTMPQSSLRVMIDQIPWNRNWQGYRYDKLRVAVKNDGGEPIGNYFVEIECPKKLLEPSTTYNWLEKERTTEEIAFFRIVANDTRRGGPPTIYPNDSKVVFELEFLHPGAGASQIKIIGRVSAPNQQPVSIEQQLS